MIAIPLVGVLGLHAGPGGMGLLTAAGWAPNLLLSLHAGAWVDRSGRYRRRCARGCSAPTNSSTTACGRSGAVGGGALGAAIGLQPTLWIAGIGALASVLWLVPSPVPRLRALPEM